MRRYEALSAALVGEGIVEDLAVWGNGDSIIPALPAPWDGLSGESGWKRAWKSTRVKERKQKCRSRAVE